MLIVLEQNRVVNTETTPSPKNKQKTHPIKMSYIFPRNIFFMFLTDADQA